MNNAPDSSRTDVLASQGFRRRPTSSVSQPSATLAGQPAEWVQIVSTRLTALAELDEGWDGQNAPRVSPLNLEIAMQLLGRVMLRGTPAPEVVPTANGGLQLEWHVPDVDVELEILSPGRYALLFEDRLSGREVEAELGSDLSVFAEALRRISSGR